MDDSKIIKTSHEIEQEHWANISIEQMNKTGQLWAGKYTTKELRAFQKQYLDLANETGILEIDHKAYDNRWKIATYAICVKEYKEGDWNEGQWNF